MPKKSLIELVGLMEDRKNKMVGLDRRDMESGGTERRPLLETKSRKGDWVREFFWASSE